MSDLLVERNGKLVGRGIGSLAEILSLPERDIGHETEEMALELLEALKGERAQPHPDGPLAALREEIARAAARRTEAESFVQELLEVRELQRSAEAELREATANLAEAIEPLREMVAQGEGLLSYGVQQDTIYPVNFLVMPPSVLSSPRCARAHLPRSDSPTAINHAVPSTESLDRLAHVCYTIVSLCEWVSVWLPGKAA